MQINIKLCVQQIATLNIMSTEQYKMLEYVILIHFTHPHVETEAIQLHFLLCMRYTGQHYCSLNFVLEPTKLWDFTLITAVNDSEGSRAALLFNLISDL